MSESKRSRADELLDEPVANPRYGGITLRDAVLKLLQPKKSERLADDPSDSELQFEL